jgi:hypothetical protein
MVQRGVGSGVAPCRLERRTNGSPATSNRWWPRRWHCSPKWGKVEIRGARWVSDGEVLPASYRTVAHTRMKA